MSPAETIPPSIPVSGRHATEADGVPVRDAATVILVRRDGPETRLLMGQRGQAAVFMPSKFVFPGGAVDPGDGDVARLAPPPPALAEALGVRAAPDLGPALAMAAIRELWEESGLALAESGASSPAGLPADWEAFFAAGHRPAPEHLNFIFRAITPPGRPRRFDARFFMVEAEAIRGDLDDFSLACEELSHLSWVTLSAARALDLPFITEIVLAEVEARLAAPGSHRRVPFFNHAGGRSFIDPI